MNVFSRVEQLVNTTDRARMMLHFLINVPENAACSRIVQRDLGSPPGAGFREVPLRSSCRSFRGGGIYGCPGSSLAGMMNGPSTTLFGASSDIAACLVSKLDISRILGFFLGRSAFSRHAHAGDDGDFESCLRSVSIRSMPLHRAFCFP